MKKVALVVGVTLVAIVAGYVVSAKVWGFPVFWSGSGKQAEQEKPVIYSLGQFITNLADPGRFIRVTVDLEITGGEKGDVVASRASELKTDIYALLRSKSYEELQGENGLRQLQKEILARIESKCPGSVRNVYFSEFIVQ
ncbi:MAG TPA: flagellar basal body-associated FliL family protein [Firmicutes bacterium]|nr:flagellar basal body-associated FliL family protein [Candidatus Fermentithermobacillaceae bacterium]